MVERIIVRENLFIKKQELLKELTDTAESLIQCSLFNKEEHTRLLKHFDKIKKEIESIDNEFEILDQVIGVQEASELWGLAPSYIKDLCAKEIVRAKKIGKTWVIDANQPNPTKSS